MGTLGEPLTPSSALLFEPRAAATIDLVASDFSLTDTDLTGLAAGTNRMLIGGELVQFLHAVPLGAGRWRLSGLLRGRGGTEPEAAKGHAAQTPVLLIDDSLVAVDSLLVPPLASSRIAAIGTGDAETVIASLANPGLSRRPPCPVHPRTAIEADQAVLYRWTRRARGHWRWEDSVEVPLVEEREAYLVGYGPVLSPHVAWQRDVPSLRLTLADRTALTDAHGPDNLWVRQVGTFDQSPPLLLVSLS